METSVIAAALVAGQQGQITAAASAKMMKMNAESAQGLAEMVQQSAEALKALVAEGTGVNLDVTL